jgi:excinuclease UvrABC ATPase subunit
MLKETFDLNSYLKYQLQVCLTSFQAMPYPSHLDIHTRFNYLNKQDNFIPLRMIVSGTAGSGKSYLIKCLVKVIRTIFASKRSVQVLCPTGNSANIISGLTLQFF